VKRLLKTVLFQLESIDWAEIAEFAVAFVGTLFGIAYLFVKAVAHGWLP
jgi:hypothetical protein